MPMQVRAVLAGLSMLCVASLLGGCSSGVPPAQSAASVAEPCSPSRCGQRPLAPSRQCKDGSFAGVGACVQTGGAHCGWQVTGCPGGG